MTQFVLRLNNFVRAISFIAIVVGSLAEPAYADPAPNRCGGCHAIGKTGESNNPKSPPFRYLSRRYPLSDLQESLAEGIIVGHEGLEMPQFQFSPGMIDALLAYMNSVQAK
jgi:cytochrome c